jgi:hypothetical protein
MPHIIYGGVLYEQVRHAIYCKLCRETIESNKQHEFQLCYCGSIGVDSGRILGNISNMEPRSMYQATIRGQRYWLPQDVIHREWAHRFRVVSPRLPPARETPQEPSSSGHHGPPETNATSELLADPEAVPRHSPPT